MLAHWQTLSDALVWYMLTSAVPDVSSADPATCSAKCAHISLAMLVCMGAAGCCMAFPEIGLCPIGGFGSRWTTMEYLFVQVCSAFHYVLCVV